MWQKSSTSVFYHPPMAKPKISRKPTMEVNQNQNHQPLKTEKPPSWFVVRGLFGCKHIQTQQQQREQKQQKQPQHRKQDQQQQSKKEKKHNQHQDQSLEETSKKCKKMKYCSGSICSNSKVMHRPETASIEVQRKRASMGSAGKSVSSRSMKGPLNEINGVVPSTNSSLSASSNFSSSNVSSFRGMPFSRFSGCYECRMVVDPVLGIARDHSLRGSICACPECGEICMKAENLELHRAVRHAGSSPSPSTLNTCSSNYHLIIIFTFSYLLASVFVVHNIVYWKGTYFSSIIPIYFGGSWVNCSVYFNALF